MTKREAKRVSFMGLDYLFVRSDHLKYELF